MRHLSSALLSSIGIRSHRPQTLWQSSQSPLVVLIDQVYYLPLDWRKLLLDACRIQVPVKQNTHLLSSYYRLGMATFSVVICDEPVIFNIDDIVYLFECISYSPVLCSLLSYFVRAEQTHWRTEFLGEKDKSLAKEVSAALEHRTFQQTLDYRALFSDGIGVNLHPQIGTDLPARLRTLYRNGLRRIKNHFSASDVGPILPAYNARKNIGYATQREYAYVLTGSYDFPGRDITTLDLLRLYHRTGDMISGPLEVRQAWFFNDLKPRTYYCMGGDAFWAGLYIQEIANRLAEILPSTNPFSRFTVSRVGTVSAHQVLITYDYTSFTTSLAELKFFLFWLSQELVGTPINFLDVHHGLRTMDLGQMLCDYNELVNHYQAFSLERFFELMEGPVFHQGRSGSLGVKGNIVLSTVLHGASLAASTGTPDDDCCVGDDALANILQMLVSVFISCVNNLGDINPDKFTIIARPPLDDPTQSTWTQYKFLKRPLSVNPMGTVSLGTLDFFPSIADALYPEGDGIHSATFGDDLASSIKTFCMQWGRFLRIQAHTDILNSTREDDLTFLLGGIQHVYKRYGLPLEGSLPGKTLVQRYVGSKDRTELRCLVPPCDSIDVFRQSWLEMLTYRFAGEYVSEPVTVGGSMLPPIDVLEGSSFDATTDTPCLSLMVDLGLLKMDLYSREVEVDDRWLDEKLRAFQLGFKAEPMLANYVVLERPTWWFDVIIPLHPGLNTEGPDETLDRISSLFSGSVI